MALGSILTNPVLLALILVFATISLFAYWNARRKTDD